MIVGGSLGISVSVLWAPLGCGFLHVLLCGSMSVSRVCACLFCGGGPLRAARSGGRGDGALGSDVGNV